MKYTKLLFAPGPVRVPDEIKYTFLHDPPYFTTAKFSQLIDEIQPKLKYVFDSSNPVLIGTGSGTLGMEMSVSNFFNRSDEVIVLDMGKYGINWAKIGLAYGLNVTTIKSEYGRFVPLDHLQSVITGNQDFKGIFITYVETTSAVKAPLDRYYELIKEVSPETLIVVDAVSALLTEQLPSYLYDVVISASQKGLQLPPGLFFMTCSDRAIQRATASKLPTFYFDVINEMERAHKNITTFTPAAPLYYALNKALDQIELVGRDDVIERTMEHAEHVRTTLAEDFQQFSQAPCNSVTACVCENSNHFIDTLYDVGLVIGGGVRSLNNKIFRMMHFGWDLDENEVESALKIIKNTYRPWL
jgi:aspartate aminotransferase-like enzyme